MRNGSALRAKAALSASQSAATHATRSGAPIGRLERQDSRAQPRPPADNENPEQRIERGAERRERCRGVQAVVSPPRLRNRLRAQRVSAVTAAPTRRATEQHTAEEEPFGKALLHLLASAAIKRAVQKPQLRVMPGGIRPSPATSVGGRYSRVWMIRRGMVQKRTKN